MAVESGLENMVDIYWHVTMMRMKNIKPFVKWECFLYRLGDWCIYYLCILIDWYRVQG